MFVPDRPVTVKGAGLTVSRPLLVIIGVTL